MKDGCEPCLSRTNCFLCKQVKETVRAKSTVSGFEIRIEGNYNCNSMNVVYLLECMRCNKQYIGETEKFRKRMNNHRSQCKLNPDTATYAHRMQTGHSFEDIEITILKGNFVDEIARRKFEKFMIDSFDTFRNGMNLQPGYMG
jgi:predicted GIY-YIG superfamily endonuclease